MNICVAVELETALKESLVYNLSLKNVESQSFAEADQGTAHDLSSGRYLEVLKSGKEVFDKLLLTWTTPEELKNSLTSFLKNSSFEKLLEVASLGVCCLQLFVEVNWLGFPPLSWTQAKEVIPQLRAFESEDEDKSRKEFIKIVRTELVLDGEYLLSVVHNIELFYFARLFLQQLQEMNNSFTASFTILYWRFRVLMIHQQLLEEKSEQIFKAIKTLIGDIDKVVNENDKKTIHYVNYLVEIAAFYDKYYDINKARQSLQQASNLVGMDLQYTGALGRRTKFQTNDFAQLTLDVDRKDVSVVEATSNTVDASLMPHDVKLDDEVRLERIKFKDECRENVPELSLVEQSIVLGQYFLQKRSKPRDALTQEELAPYLDVILRQKQTCWSIKMSALLQRSLLENDHSRTAERSLMQLETLVEHWRIPDRVQRHRMTHVYSSILMPFWVIEGELVNLLLALGSVKAALDRALKIQQWNEVIVCYNRLNLKHKSAEVILQQIEEKGESAHLYCLLGDATENIEHYKKALELSQNRSARAFRSLGLHHYFRKEYAEAVDYFQKSLDLNSFQLETLLRLGYSAIQIESWEVAASTYWKYCSYETENFEAWNNLSNSYIKLGQKARAWKVLQEAVKCDYDNWKIWDNLMVVSTDCAEFEEVLRSYHRLLDIKEGKHLDLEVLEILVKAINNNTLDNSGIGSNRHRTGALKLFGRLSSHFVAESKLWHLYARLVAGSASSTQSDTEIGPGNAENAFKAAQLMQKSLGAAVQAKDWSKNREKCVETLELASETVDFCLNASNWTENKAQSVQQLASLKLTLNSALTKVKTAQISLSSDELVDEVKPSFEKLQQDVQLVIERIAALKQ